MLWQTFFSDLYLSIRTLNFTKINELMSCLKIIGLGTVKKNRGGRTSRALAILHLSWDATNSLNCVPNTQGALEVLDFASFKSFSSCLLLLLKLCLSLHFPEGSPWILLVFLLYSILWLELFPSQVAFICQLLSKHLLSLPLALEGLQEPWPPTAHPGHQQQPPHSQEFWKQKSNIWRAGDWEPLA